MVGKLKTKSKRKLRLADLRTWQLLVLLVLVGFVAATFLRLNNTGMIVRRDAVMAADKAGDVGVITDRMYDLQRYAAAHMNAGTGPFYLQETYNRDVKKAVHIPENSSGETPQARADAICNPHLGTHGYSRAYQDCIMRELNRDGQVFDPESIVLPNPTLYRHEFIAPLWSPDYAGWSVLVAVILALIIIYRAVTSVIVRLIIRFSRHRG